MLICAGLGGKQTQQGEYMGIQLQFPTLKTGKAPLDFIIDTASSVNIVMPNVASQMAAPRTGTTASGIGGTGMLAGSYEIALGPATANNQVCTCVGNSQFAPIRKSSQFARSHPTSQRAVQTCELEAL